MSLPRDSKERDAYRGLLRKLERARDRLVAAEEPVLLALRGSIGSGKTRSAVWLLREYYASIPSVFLRTAPLFLPASDLVDLRFRALYGRGDDEEEDRREALRERLETSSLLVLDDVARVEGFRGEEHYVERTIERRLALEAPTILTLNSDDGLSERFRDLLNEFESIVFSAPSFRGSR